jgi:hypothetical protein
MPAPPTTARRPASDAVPCPTLQITGAPPDRAVTAAGAPSPANWAGYRRAMASGRLAVGDRVLEVPARHRDGRALSIALTVSLVQGPAGTATGDGRVIRDDTGRCHERTHQRDERAAAGRGPTATP